MDVASLRELLWRQVKRPLPRHVNQNPVSAFTSKAHLPFRCGSRNLPMILGANKASRASQHPAQSAMLRVILLLVMSIIWYLNPAITHVRGRYQHLLT